MGQVSTAEAATTERDRDSYSEAAAEAFNNSTCVKLALQLPNVSPQLIVSIYKAAFADGSMYGYREAAAVFEKIIAGFAHGTQH